MYINIDVEKARRSVRRLFMLMIIVTFMVGLSPLYYSIADAGKPAQYIDPAPLYQSIRQLQVETASLKMQVQSLQEENKQLQQTIADQQKTIDTYKAQIKELEQEKAQLQKEIQALKAKNKYLQSTVASLNSKLQMNLESMLPTLKYATNIKLNKFTITAYAPSAGGINCSGDCNTTAKLFKVSAIKDIDDITYCAVDPRVVPLYSVLIIQGLNKPCIAVDTGGKIKGYHIDILMHSKESAKKWGRKTRMVIVIPPK